MHTICFKFDASQPENISTYVEGLQLVVQNFKNDDLSKKLTHEFLQLNEQQFSNVGLNIILLKFQLISYAEWDQQIAIFLKDNIPLLSDSVI
mmetsp:Transcript_9015/g.8425  ORF Transcript_9015/g.8425 Transcript_9015/m.8425 type:complete len:92 (+) Transcript_9015:1909-2184(+)